MKFAVVNPRGRDADHDYAHGIGHPDDACHPPVNYHAYAACLGGIFCRDATNLRADVALVLLRKSNLEASLKAVLALQARGIRVFVSCKESGSHQVAALLGDITRLSLFQTICGQCHGALSSTPSLVPIYEAAGCARAVFIPTPYPLSEPEWNVSQPLESRRGIFVGTREFAVPSRNHFAAVLLANKLSRELSCPLTVLNTDGRSGRRILKHFQNQNPSVSVVEAPIPYVAYLRLMARHRIVWQLDASEVPGQVAGDALLCGMPCLGGNGTVDQLVFSTLAGDRGDLVKTARLLLTDDDEWERARSTALTRAREHLDFPIIAKSLRKAFSD